MEVKHEDVFRDCLERLGALLKGKVDSTTSNPGDALSNEEYEAAGEIKRHMALHGRSLSVTQQGRICNAMHEVLPGDTIVVFQGGDRLYIVRPVGDKYQLVGDAYVSGFMSGEAYDGLDPDDVDDEIQLI
jgi:hypothetical protein